MPRLRPALALLSLALATTFAGCGDGNDPVAEGHTEAVYVTTGGLKYQVQLSRKLNPYDVEDRDYLAAVPNAAKQVANQNFTWYGVFIRVENRTDDGDSKGRTLQTARDFTLVDTQDDATSPTEIPATNVYAYRSVPLKPGGQLPEASSTAAQSPIGGALLLFKVKPGVLENRPVQLHIEPVDGSAGAHVNLDI